MKEEITHNIKKETKSEIEVDLFSESQAVYKLLLDESPDPIFSFTPEGRYIYVNNAFAQGVQKTVDQIKGKLIWDVFERDEADKRFSALSKVFETGEEKVIEVRVPRTDEDRFYITTITPIKDKNNKVITAICSSKEITDRKKMEVKLKESNDNYKKLSEELKEINASKDKFLSVLSHDLRGPYQGFLGMTEILMNEFKSFPEDELEIILKEIHYAIKSQYELLDHILQWSRLQNGRIDFSPVQFPLSNEIDKVIQMMNVSIKKKQITIQNNISVDLHTVADCYLFQTLVRNLLANAIKFSFPGKGININAEHKNKMIQISIEDSGVGIDDENISKLFRKDIHHSSHGTDGERGSGIGLLLCKEIVEKHKGHIWVESKLNEGSTFYFTLPTV